MKPIRIIDMEFNILAEIDDYENLLWSRKFHSISDFEFSINPKFPTKISAYRLVALIITRARKMPHYCGF